MKLNNTFIKKTKIIATAGPTFETEELMEKMFTYGVNVVRLNISHGDILEHGKRIKVIKDVRAKLGLPISILLDTKGPEIRIHQIEGNKIKIKRNDILQIYCKKEILGSDKKFSVTYKDLANTVKIGQLILIDDGKLSLIVKSIDKENGIVTVKSENNHFISTKKAVNIPGADLTLPFLNTHDKDFIKWGIKEGIDYIAASFVRNKKDLIELRKFLDINGGKEVLIMSKIEALKAIENLNEIINYSDSIMLARGDLGVEIPYYEVPFYEKLIIEKCRAWGKPIVIATQMLDSMMENPRPTRAEVTDVYYAAISGTDATMLSGESASGDFPLESVETMARINLEAEKNYNYLDSYEKAYAFVDSSNAETAYLVAKQALTNDAKYVAVFSEKGRMINALSRFRANAIILGFIKDKSKVTKFGVNYGVYTKHHANLSDYNDDHKVRKLLLDCGIKKNTKVLLATKNEFRKITV
ncbi:MAG: pyruvate kinase [Candidatus Hepatoplasma scabrum]|nr:MAG: pyruvate kinase [Candidatus Hepatoplasma sp.]